MMAFTRFGALALGVSLLVATSQASAAPIVYPDYVGPNVTYTQVQEEGPAPLWDAPVGSGNQLLFFPSAFEATASGAGGFTSAGAQFQARVTGNSPTDTITTVNLTEFGDAQLIAPPGIGTAGTSTFAAVAGFITVLADINGPIAPVVIGFSSNPLDPLAAFFVTVTPAASLTLPSNPGVTLWSATVSIDVAAFVPNATEIQISLDNDLFAFSEAGTSASIQKKVVNGPAVIIDVIPEPGTALLLASGLAILGVRGRRNRTS